jgi:hypothetical protein
MNLQVCDVIIKTKKMGVDIKMPNDLLEDIAATSNPASNKRILTNIFTTIALWGRNTKNVKKVGAQLTHDDNQFYMCLQVVSKETYKLCFHSRKKIE